MAPLFRAATVAGPPKSSDFISLNTMPYVLCSPFAQNLLVAQSGGAPNTNVLASVAPACDGVPPLPLPPPDEHAAATSAAASTAAPRASLRWFRMGPPCLWAARALDRKRHPTSAFRYVKLNARRCAAAPRVPRGRARPRSGAPRPQP